MYSARQRGSAVLVVMVLLAVVAAIVVANTRTLHHLKGELRLIDQEQQKKYELRHRN
jgi:type II secretory pathway component PulK